MGALEAVAPVFQTQDVEARWAELLSVESIRQAFETRVAPSPLRGIDRLAPQALRRDLDREASVIQTKCANGSYQFAPYLESLRSKGRNKHPRVLGIATARDRIVLYLLKELLHWAFPECVARRLPNQYIRDILSSEFHRGAVFVVKADIKSFYEKVSHERLLALLEPRLSSPILRIVERAVRNPIVASTEHTRRFRRLHPISKGVPQGLSISNILAELYIHEIDQEVAPSVLSYFRYVDDILMFTEAGKEHAAYDELSAALGKVELTLNDEKRAIGSACMPLDYLGYRLCLPTVTVKSANIKRFLDSIATYFARYRHRSDRRYRSEFLNTAAKQRIFLEELNERISGAVSESRRYGWLFYFININDLVLLHKIDHIVRVLWRRFFNCPAPQDLKRVARAYYEARYSQRGGYIHNYDQYDTVHEKLEFLERRGHVDSNSKAQYTPEDIKRMFGEVRYGNLARLEADVGKIS